MLVAFGSSSASLADSGWLGQATATSPPATTRGSMAYDAATHTVVLLRGSQTWTWNGSTWKLQHPATTPPSRGGASMVYDTASRTVVLFGGLSTKCGHACAHLNDTWTWNGSDWTQQHPATSPAARWMASMAYDATTHTVVLFGGGLVHSAAANDTWTWNGSDWTRKHPATSPAARQDAPAAYDGATHTVVLFAGYDISSGVGYNQTWAWNGSTWNLQHPATSPSGRAGSSMAYDAATASSVLFGGGTNLLQNDTWTWNGSDWTQQRPATSPSVREEMAMAYDGATSTVVLFGGLGVGGALNDTWTWDGSTWTQKGP